MAVGASAALWIVVASGAEKATPPPPPVEHRPLHVREGTIESGRGYVTSDQCRSCHTQQYASWHDSYHRTMSQVVSPETVIADFDNVVLGAGEERYRIERRGDGFWVELPAGVASGAAGGAATTPQDTAGVAAEPERWRRIVQSTGSHHYQLYWYPTGSGRELNMLPFVFLRAERRWAPRDAVFLQPPDWVSERIVWNYQCLPCHTTDGQPGYLPGETVRPGGKSPDTRVAELGIACEMCHGPGEKHVRQYARGAAASGPAGSAAQTAIVHPAKLPAPRAAQVCGQCHSVNTPYKPEDWVDYLLDGPAFRAGEDLRKSRYVVHPDTLAESPLIQQWLASREKNLEDWFWPDGMVRVTGREYNGLTQSPCFRGGDFSCLSCHSPHASDPDEQLKPSMRGDEGCLQCHANFRARVAEHTHHGAESSGSRCYNCHMPNTTYGLLKATRSHTVDSPAVAVTLKSGRPNACNLCHLDRTLAWTARYLSEWYGQAPVEVPGEGREISAAALGLLTGDAGLRAIYAWHMGWPEAQQASGRRWLAPLLAETLDDPYAAVRYIAARSLGTFPGFEAFAYDFVAPAEDRARAAALAIRAWEQSPLTQPERARRETLISADGSFDIETARRLLTQRDNRPVLLGE